MLTSALLLRGPHPSFKPASMQITNSASSTATSTTTPAVVADVSIEAAVRTPQFYLLGITFFCLATGGIGVLSVAKPMMSEVFSTALPAIVTSAFAAKFVLMLSAGNLGGRLVWAAVSDAIGRRKTFLLFTGIAVPLYFYMPTLVATVTDAASVPHLYAFCASAALVVASMGGVYALLPAYEADLFGSKNVGAIHGRMLLFSSAAALAGPSLLLYLRSISEKAAIDKLLSVISAEKFEAAFGVSMDKVSDLIAAKTVTINKLLALAPPGTVDPTPYLYDTTMYSLAGLMAVSVVAHYLVKPMPAAIAATVTDVKDAAPSK